jgi:hypothetical protein
VLRKEGKRKRTDSGLEAGETTRKGWILELHELEHVVRCLRSSPVEPVRRHEDSQRRTPLELPSSPGAKRTSSQRS